VRRNSRFVAAVRDCGKLLTNYLVPPLFAKAIIVVDEDIDVHDKPAIFHAIGTRWQPDPATLIIPQTRGMPLDPSSPRRWLTSKAVIDATRQWPSEGGPDRWPDVSRQILEEQSPDTFELVDGRWEEYLKAWRHRN
jgi:3-polyprenyl-4-hydroxybenzoate decarboxylase